MTFGPSRSLRRRFWLLIRAGVPPTSAGVAVGVSRSTGTRWFVQAGALVVVGSGCAGPSFVVG